MLRRHVLRHGHTSPRRLNARFFCQSPIWALQKQVERPLQPSSSTDDQPQDHGVSVNQPGQLGTRQSATIQYGSNGIDNSSLGPKRLLEKAYKDGTLQIKPETVGPFLSRLASNEENLNGATLRNACAMFNIPIDGAYTLARMLLQSPGPVDRYQGRQILLAASQLGSAKATLHIVKGATKTEQLLKDEVQPALKHLQQLAAQDPPLIPALVAHAKVLEEQGEHAAAEKCYQTAIDHVPVPRKSIASRVLRKVQERLSIENDEAIPIRKINLEDDDIELDVVAAHLSLAQLQYDYMNKRDEAIETWEIAAFEYDDPVAYFKLAQDFENTARGQTHHSIEESVIDNGWVRFVPYKWYEYTMKAAVSGHAEACYNIGLFYMLKLQGGGHDIVDTKLRKVLRESPLMHAPSGLFTAATIAKEQSNRIESVHRWFLCAGKAGYNPGYLLAEFVQISQSPNDDNHISNLLQVADGGSFGDQAMRRVVWTDGDRTLARKLKLHLQHQLWFTFDEAGNYLLAGHDKHDQEPLNI